MKQKALSMLQPHASLVVLNAKRIETRSWDTKYRGTLLIHSSKGRKKPLRTLAHDPRFCEFLFNDTVELFKGYDLLPFGHIIGQVDLITTMDTEEIVHLYQKANYHEGKKVFHHSGHCWDLTEREMAFGDYSPGRHAWMFSNIIKYEKPIPAKGKLSLWDFEMPPEPVQWCNEYMKAKMLKTHFTRSTDPRVPLVGNQDHHLLFNHEINKA